MSNTSVGNKTLRNIEIGIIVVLASVPLFLSFPYRVNIFLSWEGAYRLYLGQLPYHDFGMPLGYMYWVVPSLFFKLFGPQLITLVKAQVFLNIISALAFRSILKNLHVRSGVRFLAVILFCVSFSFFNFWPWYNHTVIVYEFVCLAFLTRYFSEGKGWIYLVLAALFNCFAFLTKQDGGGLCLLIALALTAYYSFLEKKWKPFATYVSSLVLIGAAMILPFLKYRFSYWFNHGQPPHTARISTQEIINELLQGSQWIKFYLMVIAIMVFALYKQDPQYFKKKHTSLFLLLVLGILAEAAIFQVTSYTPIDNNIFFHSFAIAFILNYISLFLNVDFSKLMPLAIGAAGIMLWWSGVFWKYINRIIERSLPQQAEVKNTSSENVINRHTYILDKEKPEVSTADWTFSNLKSFKNIYMPRSTIEGIERLKSNPAFSNTLKPKVLNMSELTPLAAELPFELETGPEIPLWYHLGVSMFNKEAAFYEKRIESKYYDMVIFEHIPRLNNFYPFRVREALIRHYNLVDSFAAPRSGDVPGTIEVFSK